MYFVRIWMDLIVISQLMADFKRRAMVKPVHVNTIFLGGRMQTYAFRVTAESSKML